MAFELVYTSAPQGIRKGSSGFCVVACTNGLGPRLIAALEGLSAYKPLYPHYADNAWDNPVSRSHYLFELNGERQHILSRICFNGVDHTGRSNKLASHLVLSGAEAQTAVGGPASLLCREELFKNADWQIKVELYEHQREIPATTAHGLRCSAWEEVMGDAGWGGYLAQCYLDNPTRNIYLAYDPARHGSLMRLVDEVINLLPAEKRWDVTFNTYFVTLPAGMACTLRCVPLDSDALRLARRSPANLIIDISQKRPLEGSGGLIAVARTGEMPKAEPVKTESVEIPVAAAAQETPEEFEQPLKIMPRKKGTAVVSQPAPKVAPGEKTAKDSAPVQLRKARAPQRAGAGPAPRKAGQRRSLWVFVAAPLVLACIVLSGIFWYVVNARDQRDCQVLLEKCGSLNIALTEIEERLPHSSAREIGE